MKSAILVSALLLQAMAVVAEVPPRRTVEGQVLKSDRLPSLCLRVDKELRFVADRPNGPRDSSPGMRPKADSLGEKAPVYPSGLKGREKSLAGITQLRFSRASRGPSGRFDASLFPYLGHRPTAEALG